MDRDCMDPKHFSIIFVKPGKKIVFLKYLKKLKANVNGTLNKKEVFIYTNVYDFLYLSDDNFL